MLDLGIVADEINRDFRQASRIGVEAGIKRYEIRFLKTGRAPMCEPAELREIERICEGEGLRITALSPGLFKWTDSVEKAQREMGEVLPRSIELAKRWNLSALIIFGFCKPGAKEENADMISSDDPPGWVIDSLAEAAEKAEQSGLRLLIEAEPVCWADTGTATVNLIRAADSPALGINYDPCNVAWMTRKDPIDEFDLVAPFIGNVHIKDQLDAPLGSGLPKWVVPGEGMIDYRPHFAALRSIGYSGPVSLEPHMDGSLETIQSCKTAVENLWRDSASTTID